MMIQPLFLCLLASFALALNPLRAATSLEIVDPSDADLLIEEEAKGSKSSPSISKFEEADDLESLKKDTRDDFFADEELKAIKEMRTDSVDPLADDKKASASTQDRERDSIDTDRPEIVLDKDKMSLREEKKIISKKEKKKFEKPQIFNVGNEEHKLLELSKLLQDKITDDEWNAISAAAQTDKYVIQKGDWLWKISQRFFGSGFYYSKIWSLNPHITNPHEVEPGMTLVFTTGAPDEFPNVRLGSFSEDEIVTVDKGKSKSFNFSDYGHGIKPPWIDKRKELLSKKVYFQYANDAQYSDILGTTGEGEKEYLKYEPPIHNLAPTKKDKKETLLGFDKSSRVAIKFKEGFFLQSFVSSNVIQDLGYIAGIDKERHYIQVGDRVYVKFDESAKVKPGDTFSIYHPRGILKHKSSDRSGYRYSIAAQLKVVRKIDQLWLSEIFDVGRPVVRKDRVTLFTPKIGRINKSFNRRKVEAAIIGSLKVSELSLSFGDIIYLDRGRIDGIEIGNVFEVYSFKDRGSNIKLTQSPSYKVGELKVITLTDNFATALITNSSTYIEVGSIAITKTEEQAILAKQSKDKTLIKNTRRLEAKALDELDIEFNLDQLSKNLLDKADKLEVTEDELENLERQEQEKSVIREHEKDLKELEKLEDEIVKAEEVLREAKLDEDKFLEDQDLNKIEKKDKAADKNAFESLNDIEKEIGVKYLDENLNAKENPYGLTELDYEEIDELLNEGNP